MYNLKQLQFIIQVKNSKNFNLNHKKSRVHVEPFVSIPVIQVALEEVFML